MNNTAWVMGGAPHNLRRRPDGLEEGEIRITLSPPYPDRTMCKIVGCATAFTVLYPVLRRGVQEVPVIAKSDGRNLIVELPEAARDSLTAIRDGDVLIYTAVAAPDAWHNPPQ
jgi:hypothetical protein